MNHAPPGVRQLPATARGAPEVDAPAAPEPLTAIPEGELEDRGATAVRFAPGGDVHRSMQRPARPSRPHPIDGHQPGPDRSTEPGWLQSESIGRDRSRQGMEHPRSAREPTATGRSPVPGTGSDGFDAEEIRPLQGVFPLATGESPALPVLPTRPQPPCGPGFGSDRWWRCAR